MDGPLDVIRSRVDGLARELDDVRRRLDRLERRPDEGASAEAVLGVAIPQGPVRLPGVAITPLPTGVISLLGRTLMVLGGAYLLRAITDAGLVPGLVGAVAGLVYAAAFLLLADRAAAAGRRTSALFHGFAAVAIAYPLVWEATGRFATFTPATAACALLVFVALGLVVAERGALWEIAWASTLLAILTALGLLIRTHELVTITIALWLMAVGVEGAALRDRWLSLRWPAAIGLDLVILMVAMVELRRDGPPEGYETLSTAILVSMGLGAIALYLSSTSARTLLRGRPISAFEIVQTAVALVIGYGGATSVVMARGGSPMALGILGLLLGVAGYAAAFGFLERRPEFGRNFYAYTTLGGVLTLVGTRLVFGEVVLALAWSGVAVGALWLGARFERMTLKMHGALYGTAATVAAGLLGSATDALLESATGPWRAPTAVGATTFVFLAAGYGILVRARGPGTGSWWGRLPQAIVAAILAWSVAGLAAAGLTAAVAGAPGPGTDAAVVAAVRTAVLAGVSVGLAWAGQRWSLSELKWLVYPLLGGGALKLLAEDLRQGRPATLFLAFALYGAALFATPRLMRNEEGKRPEN
jgi:hypothetical protein